MKTSTTPPAGFTLTEFVMASFVTALVLLTIGALYVSCGHIMRRTSLQTWAKQQGMFATHAVQDVFRPAVSFTVFPSYTAQPGPALLPGQTGTYCIVFNLHGHTSGFYFAHNALYFVPDESSDLKPYSGDDIMLATSIAHSAHFTFTYNQLDMYFRIPDPDDPQKSLFSTHSLFTPRNVPID